MIITNTDTQHDEPTFDPIVYLRAFSHGGVAAALGGTAAALVLALLADTGADGIAVASVRGLALYSGLSVSTVRRHLDALVACNVLLPLPLPHTWGFLPLGRVRVDGMSGLWWVDDEHIDDTAVAPANRPTAPTER